MSEGARAADCSSGLWRIIKLAEESLRRLLEVANLAGSSWPLYQNYAPRDPFTRMELQTSVFLPEIERASFFPFHTHVSFSRSTSVSFAAERDANVSWTQPKRTFSFSFSLRFRCPKRLDRQRFLHWLDINERTSRIYQEKTLEVNSFSQELLAQIRIAKVITAVTYIRLTDLDRFLYNFTRKYNNTIIKYIFHFNFRNKI